MADVTLPQLGETVTEGTITRWFKKVGEQVAADEPLFEVSTDKVDTEVPSPIAGVVQQILAQEGDTVPVGAVIAVVGTADAAPADEPAPSPTAESAAVPAAEPAAEAEPAAAPAAAEPGPAAEAAPLPPAPDVAEPEAAPAPEPSPEPAPEPAPAVESPTAPAAQADQPSADEPAAGASPKGDSRLLSPVVRRLVGEHGLNPDDIPGTGPGGRITRDDVLDYIDSLAGGTPAAPAPAAAPAPVAPAASAPAPAPAPAAPEPAPAPTAAPAAAPAPAPAAAPAPVPATPIAPAASSGDRDTSVKLSKIRKLTGSHMVMSKGVSPHAFSVVEVDYANVDTTRAAVKGHWKSSEGFGLTYLPFITRAIVDALSDFPHLNASVADNELIVHNFIDIGIAVDLDFEGLLVPVVRSAETKRLRAIAREIYDLATRARTRKLGPDEISGGTFTISNNGSAGSVLTIPIINQPQVAILSTDAIVRKPVAVTLPSGDEAIVIHPVGNLAMSWDHRAFDGAYAAGFLVRVKEILETRDWNSEL
jgi:pyruvate dehydrogenase E2 component (dihydrolipoamide acetyltransferase)